MEGSTRFVREVVCWSPCHANTRSRPGSSVDFLHAKKAIEEGGRKSYTARTKGRQAGRLSFAGRDCICSVRT
jgi:hypothetical protein